MRKNLCSKFLVCKSNKQMLATILGCKISIMSTERERKREREADRDRKREGEGGGRCTYTPAQAVEEHSGYQGQS